MKVSLLFFATLLAGYANAQNFCDIAKAVIPSGITCSGTGAEATLSSSIKIPISLTSTTTLTLAFAQKPCSPASASVTVTDSAKAIISSGSASVAISSGTSSYAVPGASLNIPTVGIIGLRLDVTVSGGINAANGLGFKVAVSVCVADKCNGDLSSTLAALVTLPVPVLDMNVPKATFTDAQLTTLCPPPKPSSSESLQSSLLMAAAAVGAAMIM
jgi:hypothetical protein